MLDSLFSWLGILDDFFWTYIGFAFICIPGVYLTFKSRALQIRALFSPLETIREIRESTCAASNGISPFKLFFASAGGSVGMGNIVGIASAVMIGGVGSIFWMWIASIIGMLLKYSEIYLGIKYREKNTDGTYSSGPMYFLRKAFKSNFLAYVAAVSLCVYGVEIYQFQMLTERVAFQFNLNKDLVLVLLLIAVLYSSIGGIRRMATLCTWMLPIFMLGYIALCIYVVMIHSDCLLSVAADIVKYAFTTRSSIGGFIGSSWILAAHYGVSKTVYSADICIGYDSIVQSETSVQSAKTQAKLGVFAVFTDTFICFLTTMVIAVTNSWITMQDVEHSNIISNIFIQYFPHADIILTLIFFFAGFTTVIAYFAVGVKAACFLHKKYGKIIYILYASASFCIFGYCKQDQVVLIMSICSGILMVVNVLGILKLRNEIEY